MAQIVQNYSTGQPRPAPRPIVVRPRERSPLAGVLLFLTVATSAFLATLLYGHPEILTSGLSVIAKEPLDRLPKWIHDASVWANAGEARFWGVVGGGIVGLWLLTKLPGRACCRRQLCLLLALVPTTLAGLVLVREWGPVRDLVRQTADKLIP